MGLRHRCWKDEVLARRIGDGELTAIGVLSEVANAQQEYFSQNHEFAQKFVSDNGQHDGLYWPVAEGQKPSPLGPLAEVAKALGYSHSDKAQPFNGYYYRILTRQGVAAKGGAEDYLPVWQDDWRFCPPGLAGQIPGFGNYDLYCWQRWNGVSERSWRQDCGSRQDYHHLRSRQRLECGTGARIRECIIRDEDQRD